MLFVQSLREFDAVLAGHLDVHQYDVGASVTADCLPHLLAGADGREDAKPLAGLEALPQPLTEHGVSSTMSTLILSRDTCFTLSPNLASGK